MKQKIASENLIRKASLAKGIKSICLRYFNPVGSHKDYAIVEDFQNQPNNLMPRLIQTVKNNTNSIDTMALIIKQEMEQVKEITFISI